MDEPVTEITVVGDDVIPIAGEEMSCVTEEVIVEDQVVMIDDGSVHYITDIGFQEEEVVEESCGDTAAMMDVAGEVQIVDEAAPSAVHEVELVEDTALGDVVRGEDAEQIAMREAYAEEAVAGGDTRQEVIFEGNEVHDYAGRDQTAGGLIHFSNDAVVEETVDDSIYLAEDERLPEEIMQPESTADEDEQIQEEVVMEVELASNTTAKLVAEHKPEDEKIENRTDDENEVGTTTTNNNASDDNKSVVSDDGDVICVESGSEEEEKDSDRERNGVHSTGEQSDREQIQQKRTNKVPFRNPFESGGEGSDEDIFLATPADSSQSEPGLHNNPDTTTKSQESDSASEENAETEDRRRHRTPARVPILESDWLQHHSTSRNESSNASEARELPKKRWKRRHASTEARESINNGSSDSPMSVSPVPETEEESTPQVAPLSQRKGRGRPRKSHDATPVSSSPRKKIEDKTREESSEASTKRRGRPKKSEPPVMEKDEGTSEVASPQLGRGQRPHHHHHILSQVSTDDSTAEDEEWRPPKTSKNNKTPKQQHQPREAESLSRIRTSARKRKISEGSSDTATTQATRGQADQLKRKRNESVEDRYANIASNARKTADVSGRRSLGRTQSQSSQSDTENAQSKGKKGQVKKSQLNSVEGMFAKIAEQAAMAAAEGKEEGRSRRLRTRTEPSADEDVLSSDDALTTVTMATKTATTQSATEVSRRIKTDRQRTKSVPIMQHSQQKPNKQQMSPLKVNKGRGRASKKHDVEIDSSKENIPQGAPSRDKRPCYMTDPTNMRPYKSRPGQVFVSGTYICDECSFHTTRQNLIIQHYKEHFRSTKLPVRRKGHAVPAKDPPKDDNEQSSTRENHSTWDLDDEDEVSELPAMFAETPVKAPPHGRGDLVWVKIRRFPFWPAVIKNAYMERKKLRKITVKFIGEFNHVNPKRGYCLNYSKRTTVPFLDSHSQHARLKEEGTESEMREAFLDAVTKAEDFIRKKVLGLPCESLEFFEDGLSDIEIDSCEGNPIETAPDCSSLHGLDDTAEFPNEDEDEDQMEVRLSSSDEEEDIDVELSEALKKRKAKQRIRHEKLVECIKTDNAKKYLYAVYKGSRASDLHNLYQMGGEARRCLRLNSSHGPIDDEDLADEIFAVLKKYYQELFSATNYDIHYLLDVWTPEAIVYAMRKTNKYSKKRAWDIFRQGVQKTKEEQTLEHLELIQSAAKIDSESRARYNLSLDKKIQAVKQSLNFTA